MEHKMKLIKKVKPEIISKLQEKDKNIVYVKYGEIWTNDDEYVITWDSVYRKSKIYWSYDCPKLFSSGTEEGIRIDDNGYYSGYDKDHKCYLRYNEDIRVNEHCIQLYKV